MEATAVSSADKTLGRVFAEERERQGLSRAEAAQRLHMSAYQVEALESGDFSRLPQGTFLRGFVRNYAKVLGLDPGAALAQLADSAPRAPAPGIVVPSQNIRFDPLGGRLTNPYVKAGALAAVAVALTFTALYWWLFIRTEPPAAARKPAPEAASTGQAAGVAPASAGAQGGPPQQIAAAPLSAPEATTQLPTAAPTEPVPAAAPPASTAVVPPAPPKAEPPKAAARKSAASARVVKMRFRGDSWVEIRDAQGKVLFSKLNPRGSEAEVAGSPPLTVIVGNAPEVQVLYDDREFPLEPHTRVAVARFTLD